MEQLQHVYPKQAAFLSNITPAMWQNCEQLNLGYSTHFTLTNNVAESLGSRLLLHDYGQECIRDLTAGPMIRGI